MKFYRFLFLMLTMSFIFVNCSKEDPKPYHENTLNEIKITPSTNILKQGETMTFTFEGGYFDYLWFYSGENGNNYESDRNEKKHYHNSSSFKYTFNADGEFNVYFILFDLTDSSEKVFGPFPISVEKVKIGSGFPNKHPFARIAEYNVSATPGVFTDSHNNDKSGYFTWDEAQTASPEGYELPSVADIATFIPTNGDGTTNLSDALFDYRIIGNENERTAYRYEKVGGDAAGRFASGDTKSGLRITGRYLGGSSEITLDNIKVESWWAENKDNDIIHFFPYTGQILAGSEEVTDLGQRMHYKLLNARDGYETQCLILHSLIRPTTNNLHVGSSTLKTIKGSVRCIKKMN